jgi:fumarate reductase flavoprotein subunit
MAWALRTLPAALLRPFVLSYVTTFLAPEIDMFRKGVLLVSPKGEIIEIDPDRPGAALAKQSEPNGYMILDAALTDTFSRWPNFVSTAPNVAYAYMQDYRRMRPDLYRQAPDIEGLAALIGADGARLTASVKKHRDGRGQGKWSGTGPFVALGPVRAWTILTDGGVAVDTEHRVLRQDGSVVDGLYAAGSAGQGGLLLDGHGHHLGWAFTSGRRAGQHAATHNLEVRD